MLIRGWALGLASPVSRIELMLDGRLLGRAALGRIRTDAAANAATELSGFEFRLDLSRLDWLDENALLGAQVTLLNGEQAELPPVRIAIARPIAAAPLSEPAVGPVMRPAATRPTSARLRLL
ncbi:MAG TPA: hypothetical protein VE865_17450, partial [Bradyrhizobium sp.]|nr:hypothetical protein [Bradyrhizobium sp.]